MKAQLGRFISTIEGRLRTASNGKRQILHGAAALAAVGSFFSVAPLTFADQMVRMQANLPFQFQLGDKILPAGHYSVEIDRTSNAVVFRSATEYANVRLAAGSAYRSDNDATNGRLTFDNYGATHVLKKLWLNGESKGYVIRQNLNASWQKTPQQEQKFRSHP